MVMVFGRSLCCVFRSHLVVVTHSLYVARQVRENNLKMGLWPSPYRVEGSSASTQRPTYSYFNLQVGDFLPQAEIFYIGRVKNLGFWKKRAIDLKTVMCTSFFDELRSRLITF